ncbi:MAG TPA: GTP cyclohydrolase I [Actinomycetota bacterium]|nr:GTP cyclohydrolase I [Actinomycetota bacterium]
MTNSSSAVASPVNGKASRNVPALTRLEIADDPEGDSGWTKVKPRNITPAQWETLVASAGNILSALGMDLDTPGTYNTPERFLKALFDSTSGYEGDANLLTAFPSECPGGAHCAISQIIEGPISFFALCEHHAFPFFGRAHVGYIAHENIIGISKLTRLVRLFARRFTVQERMGQEIADTLVKVLEPHGVAVHIEATHLCTQMRGVREEQSRTWTSFWRGSYEIDPDLRREFSDSIRNQSLGG